MSKKQDIEVLAKTMYGEARGEVAKVNGGLASLIAVGNVIMNRVRENTWYGDSVSDVCQKPWQFSCWNENDPNRIKLLNLRANDNEIYNECLVIASQLVEGRVIDLTKGSNHYHVKSMLRKPRWSKGKKPVFRIGSHVFYKL